MREWTKTIAEYIAQREGLCVDDIFLVWSCKTRRTGKRYLGVPGTSSCGKRLTTGTKTKPTLTVIRSSATGF